MSIFNPFSWGRKPPPTIPLQITRPSHSAVRNILRDRSTLGSAPARNGARVRNIFTGNSPLQRNTRKRYNNNVKELDELGSMFLDAVVNGNIDVVVDCIAIKENVLYIKDLNDNSVLGIICVEALRIEKAISSNPSFATQKSLHYKLGALKTLFSNLLTTIENTNILNFIIKQKNKDGNTPLLLACLLRTFDSVIMELLLSKIFLQDGMRNTVEYINIVNNNNETALYTAHAQHNEKIKLILILLGASTEIGKPSVRDTLIAGFNIYKMPDQDVVKEIVEQYVPRSSLQPLLYFIDGLRIWDLNKSKIYKGFYCSRLNIQAMQYWQDEYPGLSKGDTVPRLAHEILIEACYNGIPPIITVLIDKYPDIINSLAKEYPGRNTALITVCERSFPDVDTLYIVNLFIKRGANINIQNSGGWTALMVAISNGNSKHPMYNNSDVIKALLNAGADTALKTKEGFTALSIARSHQRQDIIDLLTKPVKRGGRRNRHYRKTLRRRRDI